MARPTTLPSRQFSPVLHRFVFPRLLFFFFSKSRKAGDAKNHSRQGRSTTASAATFKKPLHDLSPCPHACDALSFKPIFSLLAVGIHRAASPSLGVCGQRSAWSALPIHIVPVDYAGVQRSAAVGHVPSAWLLVCSNHLRRDREAEKGAKGRASPERPRESAAATVWPLG